MQFIRGEDMYGIFTAAFSYTAALVGAGFASGQEIISFFVRYGNYSFIGIAAAAAMFGLFAAIVLSECVQGKITCYDEYLNLEMNKPFKRITELVTFIYSLVVFCVMASCCGEMGYALFGADVRAGTVLLCIMCGAVFLMGTNGALDFNAVLGVIITVGIITCCFYILTYREHQTFSNSAHIAASSLSYSGYNLLSAGCVLVPLSGKLKSRGEAWLTGAVSACAMLVMMLLMWWILSIYYGKINLGEIPMLTMAMRQNKTLTVIYSILLFAAVLSTAVSNGIGCVNIMAGCIGKKAAGAFVILCGLCLGMTGFSNLINTAYRICGYAGIAIAAFILIKFFSKKFKMMKNEENKRKHKIYRALGKKYRKNKG